MRSNPRAKVIIGAVVLTLLASTAVSAQVAKPPPQLFGPSLISSVVTSALDDAAGNQLIEDTARDFHEAIGGLVTTKKNGWFPVAPAPDTNGVIEGVLSVIEVPQSQQPPNVVVASGSDGQAIVGLARNFPRTHFIDLSQQAPCVTNDGQPDPSGTCEGELFGIPTNYSAVEYQVEDGAYLAGLLAAKASAGRLGIISGYSDCVECNRYIRGFVSGARSIDPAINIDIAYLADDEISGFGDPVSAKTFTESFINVFQPDVIMPVGRAVTLAMIEAACDADIRAVGTGIDVRANNEPKFDCVITSVTKDLARGVDEAMYAFAGNEVLPLLSYDLASGGVAVTDEWRTKISTLPVDTADYYQSAETAIKTGQLDPCPGDCDTPLDAHGDEPVANTEGPQASAAPATNE